MTDKEIFSAAHKAAWEIIGVMRHAKETDDKVLAALCDNCTREIWLLAQHIKARGKL